MLWRIVIPSQCCLLTSWIGDFKAHWGTRLSLILVIDELCYVMLCYVIVLSSLLIFLPFNEYSQIFFSGSIKPLSKWFVTSLLVCYAIPQQPSSLCMLKKYHCSQLVSVSPSMYHKCFWCWFWLQACQWVGIVYISFSLLCLTLCYTWALLSYLHLGNKAQGLLQITTFIVCHTPSIYGSVETIQGTWNF